MCKILLISGHGAGDPGAIGTHNGTIYKESELTRELTLRIKSALEAGYVCEVERYPSNRNAYYDLMSNNLAMPLSGYTYVLEVHFNAIRANKDGEIKGAEIYSAAGKKDTATESYILSGIETTGMDIDRGKKVYDWAVITNAQRKGSSAALLEVCFIDDEDDMSLYLKSKEQIAEGIAKGIAAGCLLEERKNEMQRYSDVKPDNWFYDAVEKVSDAGLMQGSDGKFRPNDTVTRAEMATILSRFLERK